jgi:hypothetical protein
MTGRFRVSSATKPKISRIITKYREDPTTKPLNRGVCREKSRQTPNRRSQRRMATYKALCRTTHPIPLTRSLIASLDLAKDMIEHAGAVPDVSRYLDADLKAIADAGPMVT